jgi:hypothetical protein
MTQTFLLNNGHSFPLFNDGGSEIKFNKYVVGKNKSDAIGQKLMA